MMDINNSNTNKPIVIVGAGITGCVIGHELAKKGRKVVIIEKNGCVGGLAKTFNYGDISFDIGPHRFHTHKEKVLDFIKDVLGDNYLTISRHSEVYFLGKYYPWPLRPTIMFDLPLHITLKSAWELFLMFLNNKRKKIHNFEDYILVNYGPTLYNVFFKEYTEKFLGMPTREVHFEWAREAMRRAVIDEELASRNLLDILKLTLNFRADLTEFIYPLKGGIGFFCESLKERIERYGGEIVTGGSVADMICRDGKIEEIVFNGMNVSPEVVVWTAPLDEICGLLKVPYRGLEYLSLLLYNVETDKPFKRNYQWCYYGDKKIIFNRVSMPRLFSENMVSGEKNGLAVEVNVRENDECWNNPGTLTGRIREDLARAGLISNADDIKKIHVEKIKNAYPVYTIDYLRDLKKIKTDLTVFKNLVLAGRTGLFWYNNMDDCIENGIETADKVILNEP
jgi:protoporphyrinogen oxidase